MILSSYFSTIVRELALTVKKHNVMFVTIHIQKKSTGLRSKAHSLKLYVEQNIRKRMTF